MYMSDNKLIFKKLCFLICLGAVLFGMNITHSAAEEKTPEVKSYAMSEAELQAQIMSFVDRFSAIMVSEFRQAENLSGNHALYDLQSMITYTLYNAYIIAGDSDPDIALLDMLCLVTLGRIIFEEEGTKLYGPAAKPMTKGFRLAEKEILKISAGVLKKNQIEKIVSIIQFWRKNNPEIIYFQFMRFSNISGQKRKSKVLASEEPDGILDTVEFATEQVEEVRLLAERGIYLATRLPQFWVAFGELGLSRLFENPQMKEALANFTLLSQVSNRLTTAAEELSDQISEERKTAISQTLEAITRERQMVIDQLLKAISNERQAAVDDILTRAEKQSRELIDYTMRWLLILIGICFLGYVTSRVILRLVPQRKSDQQ